MAFFSPAARIQHLLVPDLQALLHLEMGTERTHLKAQLPGQIQRPPAGPCPALPQETTRSQTTVNYSSPFVCLWQRTVRPWGFAFSL